jgi:REP element-mobilizing transposase RayT
MNPSARISGLRYFHVSFSTKGRKPALVDEVGALIRDSFFAIAKRTGLEVLELMAIEDHVHLLLGLSDQQKLSTAMHDLKGASAHEVFGTFPELRFDMGSNSFWQKGYGARLVHDDEVETVRHYIRTQADRALRHVGP